MKLELLFQTNGITQSKKSHKDVKESYKIYLREDSNVQNMFGLYREEKYFLVLRESQSIFSMDFLRSLGRAHVIRSYHNGKKESSYQAKKWKVNVQYLQEMYN